ncbi:unnamed protein product [Eruca vesicaria subsp. sativa]|uniref:Defensin-like protein n=1 Tax=Eruca vesicaria subsp. sativa TaxID=29727 RepID=A0ABC8LBZ4_ERUVS|nr:unnamed protein product [Eruca vesicaria subsp. sativa]
MAKIFINTLHLSALMMFLLFVSSGLPKVNGQCQNEVGELEGIRCPGLLSEPRCDASCKARFGSDHIGECKPEDNGVHCHCYKPC